MSDAEVITQDERLRRIEAITDAALSGLDVAELLDELLDRVRDLLRVDTAVILLLDTHSNDLVATAAKGLEEEVRRGVRVGVGRGFAGRVAADRQPVTIHDVSGLIVSGHTPPNDVRHGEASASPTARMVLPGENCSRWPRGRRWRGR